LLFKLAVFINTLFLAWRGGFTIRKLFSFSALLNKLLWASHIIKTPPLFFLCSVNSLGISDELKQKLQDVMVDRHKLTLGKTLGEGTALFWSLLQGQT